VRSTFLPFALPDTDETEITEIAEAVRSGWVTTGPKTHQFELEFAAYVGAKHAIAVSSCTSGLHLALEAMSLRAGGDESMEETLTVRIPGEIQPNFSLTISPGWY